MKKLISLILIAAFCCCLCACGAETEKLPASATDIAPEGSPAESPAAQAAVSTPEPTVEMNIMVLSGTTGFGMAKLMNDTAAGTSALSCTFSVETDASNVTAALVNGSCDIAALPTNAAAALYQKTGGAVQCLALNTLGVLYLVTGEGETVTSLADLEGKTVYAPAQNPSFIFSALCEKAGVSVTVDNTFAQPADLRTAVASGQVTLAVLPEPMVTIACTTNEALSPALDLTAAWDKVFPAGSLVQGCVAVRREFAEAHPETIRQFLTEYADSISFVTENPEDAARMIADAGILSAAHVAKAAIPRCNLCFLAGEDMIRAMNAYLEIMLAAAPNSVGGSLPGEDFYCIF